MTRENHFRRTWEDLATEGWCDSLDSQEYVRVATEWAEHDYPDPSPFIKLRANRPPSLERIKKFGKQTPDGA